MSECLSKKAVLGWLKKRLDESQFVREVHALAEVVAKIECGRFDADQTEVQRLRAALGHIHAIIQSELDDLQYEGKRKTWEEILLTVEEALSTTTEPTDALPQVNANAAKVKRVRDLWGHPMAAGAYRAGIRDTLSALGIIIPGINALEGEESDA